MYKYLEEFKRMFSIANVRFLIPRVKSAKPWTSIFITQLMEQYKEQILLREESLHGAASRPTDLDSQFQQWQPYVPAVE